jgi:hypothetical protein
VDNVTAVLENKLYGEKRFIQTIINYTLRIDDKTKNFTSLKTDGKMLGTVDRARLYRGILQVLSSKYEFIGREDNSLRRDDG